MANMPWLVAQGAANGYATNYTSDNGGSLLDYLWLASGSCHSSANCSLPPATHDFNCNGNDCYYPGKQTSDPITDDNIFRELNNAGISWKVYAQSYSLAGGTVTTPDNPNTAPRINAQRLDRPNTCAVMAQRESPLGSIPPRIPAIGRRVCAWLMIMLTDSL